MYIEGYRIGLEVIASGDFLGRKNFKLPGDSTVGNFGQLGADGQLHKIFDSEQVKIDFIGISIGGSTVLPFRQNGHPLLSL